MEFLSRKQFTLCKEAFWHLMRGTSDINTWLVIGMDINIKPESEIKYYTSKTLSYYSCAE